MLIQQIHLLLDHIIKYSFDEIFVTDATGNIIFLSEKFKDLFGMETEKMLHQNVYSLEKNGILSPSVTGKVLQTQKIETIIQETATGRKLVVSGYPIFDEKQKILGALSFSRDITELDYLKKSNDQVAKTMLLYEKEIEKMKNNQMYASPINNGKMGQVFHIVEKVSSLDVTVLLVGESGVGKNYFAQKIHQQSNRKNEPFIEVNCGAIPESLIESELFGYEEGAFTGARKGGKKGYFEAAGNGTIFLDEIAELPLNLQVNLLSVLQNRTIQRVGGQSINHVNCRIICATNQDLQKLIAEKKFREDLYYRINVIKIDIPPLRERREEINQLVTDLLDEFNDKHKMNKELSSNLIAWINRQDWLGNIRELRNFIERILITSNDNFIDVDQVGITPSNKDDLTLDQYIELMERDYIVRMFEKYPSSIKLAKKLGISQSTANRKINQYVRKT
ncbi:sigma-54 interaction domain-containing protein [Peribacillus huizhouensis]|uniref:HTH-type transcriptional regulatory protein TyrR n=1 Tax=Peribacillus huizhouensis TaxID=1501239 RepID=A0ABR6CQB9_9BACI|nr:sigma 54-interacting transcriptional regulator [Peribacillus huizhouensis]MBA9027155.1 PAS domain S-box-containing protein/TyrR family helix-turn-helix protein [Peribacillus huizhouensis]